MNYEDDELERMRARREQRRAAEKRGSGHSTETRRSASDGGDAFRSGYSGPRGSRGSSVRGSKTSGSSGRGHREQKVNNRKRRPDKKKRIMIIAAEILILLVLVVGAAGWYIYERTFGSLQVIDFNEEEVQNVNLTDDQIEGMKGYLTIACFGVDSRNVGGKMNVGKGTNSDVNMICSVNLETGEIRLASVFRDTYLNVNDKNSYNKINYAYAQGGPEQAVKALNKNLGLNMTQYATFNWKAVADAINILGGIDITLSENEFSWINAYITETVEETGIYSTHLKKAGDVHLDGVQAVAYGRLRLGDTDYARTERQRIVLNKAFEKAKKADWVTLNCVIETVMPQVATNLTLTDLIPLAKNITTYHMGDTYGFPAARGEMDIGKIGDCVVPQTLEYNVKELHKFLFDEPDYKVPSNVSQYSEHIASVSGMYNQGKLIGHVPVDQGVNARSYVKRKAQKQADKVAAEAAEKKAEEDATRESSTEETDETDESSTDESGTADSSESSTDESWGDWDDWPDWDDEDNEGYGPGSVGPGSGPGSSTRPSSASKPGSDKTTEADPDGNATGPAATGPGNSNVTKPGETKENNSKPTAESSVSPNSSPTSGGNSPSGNNSPSGGNSPSGNNSTSGGNSSSGTNTVSNQSPGGSGPSGPGA
ncbi:LCP family protein [uncultured Clostridium sp.]|uniref:LCP family protein n=1 Tax=uncultured Clostridium sp. TaxID=59620 RepID=UPI0025CF24DD|nr:LCP family protein [uncultured Clostridium sp.]